MERKAPEWFADFTVVIIDIFLLFLSTCCYQELSKSQKLKFQKIKNLKFIQLCIKSNLYEQQTEKLL